MAGRNQADPDIIMIRHDMENLPHFNFPAGFSIKPITPSNVPEWPQIWQELTPPGMIRQDTFEKNFGTDWIEIGDRCFFIIDTNGYCVGTISAWFNNAFRGGNWGQIHWVALRKEFQGKGLAKPMLSMAMEKLALKHPRSYLVTQPSRIPAISLYLKFGFLPDIDSGESRSLWKQIANNMEKPVYKTLILSAID